MTLKFLDKLQNQTNDSHVVTITSTCGLSESPFFSLDSSTFKFMQSIGEHLKSESLQNKIKTTCVMPNYFHNGKIISEYLNK